MLARLSPIHSASPASGPSSKLCSSLTIVSLDLNASSPASARPLSRLLRVLRWNWSSCSLAMRPAILGSPHSDLLSNGNALNMCHLNVECTDVHRLISKTSQREIKSSPRVV
ncbi:hypothetical protein FIBSPDRAFT_876741 [Athelia psychrophila]|uniref:Uncharacterized protein n=1 Tax=Athelia psychrophila TaxID=1759441 RepID=A0A167WKM4_9AGAM|nr:hypothetical protein FIBSPDRAFT_876741 [Fibularhizoctonia sp. CBS 109695]